MPKLVKIPALALVALAGLGGAPQAAAPGVTVSGRVLAPRGEPVPGVRVELRPRSPGSPATASTDAHGAFEIRGVPPGDARVVVEHDLGDADVEVTVGPGAGPLIVNLDDRGRIGGRVVRTDGEPVGFAMVSLEADEQPGPRWAAEDDPYFRVGSTDGEGRFRFRRLRQGGYRVRASAHGLRSAGPPFALTLGGPIEDLELVLAPGEVISGRVVGLPAGELGAVTISAVGEDEGSYGWAVDLDLQGSFRIEGLAPDRWTVRAVQGPGRRASAVVEVIEGGGPHEVELDLGGGFELSGSVRVDGEPLASGEVGLSAVGRGWSASVRTGADGGFSVAGLEPGAHRLEVSKERVRLGERTLDLAPGDEVHLDLDPGGLGGRVLDADGSPVAGGSVYLWEPADLWSSGILGQADLDPRGRFDFPHLAAGTYDVSVGMDDGQSIVERVAVTAGERREVELQLEAGGELIVIPLTAERVGIDRLVLTVLDETGVRRHQQAASRSADGTYSFSRVPTGDLRIVVSALGKAGVEARATVPGPPVEVTLPPATMLAVELPALDPPPDRVSLTLAGGDGTGPPATISRSLSLSDGRGVIADLPPGTWAVRATAPDGREWRGAATTAPDRAARLVLE